ncbi:MAG: hypothetical protein IJ600_05425 [Lachnospiraceae bacterium]|nr:hypothetical protein [Lachnospiraceae bacterium]
MAWCPKCRYEYVDGVKECPRCHMALVESLQQETDDVSLTAELPPKDDPVRAAMPMREQGRPYVYAKPYQSQSQKAVEARNSGLAMLILGGVFLLFVILWAFDTLPIKMPIVQRFSMCGILGIFALAMVIFGAFSMRSFRRLTVFAEEEDRRTAEILKWADTLEREKIDQVFAGQELEEGMLYYARTEVIRKLVTDRFMNLAPEYIEEMCEQIYQKLYEAPNA